MHIKMKLGAMIFGAIWILASCGETYDLNGFDWEPDNPPSDSVYNREIQILDMGGNNLQDGQKPLDTSDPIYFSLERFSPVHRGYKTSNRWDIAFRDAYHSGVTANNGTAKGLGYGSTGIGGLAVLDTPYSKVDAVPANIVFDAPGEAGIAFSSLFGGNKSGGHIWYTFFETIYPNVTAQNSHHYQHMVYTLSERFASSFPIHSEIAHGPKTFIIRTARGNYVKLETQSYYKGTLEPLDMSRLIPVGYISFRYMVIKAEEARFGFVERRPPLTIDMTNKKTIIGN